MQIIADILFYDIITDILYSGMDIKDCPTAWDNWKHLSDNWTSHPKFEPSFMPEAVVGTEKILAINAQYQVKNVGRWIFSSDKWKLPKIALNVQQDKFQNKLMSNPGIALHNYSCHSHSAHFLQKPPSILWPNVSYSCQKLTL